MTPARRRARLAAIADELDAANARTRALYDERERLWIEGRDAGESSRELAEPSRVRPVTVRAIIGGK